MKTSDSIEHISAALHEAAKNIGAAVKGKDNPFFKSKYADLGSVIKAFKEAALDAGLVYTQFPISGDGVIGVRTRVMHTSGEYMEDQFFVPLAKADPQAAGAIITYCRRYALAAIFGIPTADSDAEAAMFRETDALPDEAIASLESAATLDELQKAFKALWGKYPQHRQQLTGIKDTQKKALASGESE